MASLVIPKIKVEFSLSGMKRFVSFTIPEIKIYCAHIPTETKKLKIVLQDLNFKNFPHRKKIIPYEGNDIIMQETFKIIPLSPLFRPHKYQLVVFALDENKSIIATGESVQAFPQD